MRSFVTSALVFSMIMPNYSWARSDLDVRVTRLENIVANELNIKLLNQLDAMQQELRELRGKVEEQQNSMQTLSQKQEKIFLNLDARLNKLGQANMPADVVPAAPIPETPIVANSEKSLFDSAYSLMRSNKYQEAVLEFKDLLWQYPEGTYAAHAYYWLGELYMVQWQHNRTDSNLLVQAKESFTTITNKYQGQERAGDALLKLGLIEIDLEHLAVAKDILQQVIAKYPNTARARIAENNLKKITQ